MIINAGPYRRSKLPVLNGSFPADIHVKYPKGGSTSATFKVEVAQDGKPAEYTYQWYLDGSAVSGATGKTYTATFSTSGTHKVWCIVTNKAGSIKSRESALTVSQIFTKSWTGSSDMDFYYGDGSDQPATNVGVFNDLKTRYGQVLWFDMDKYGGKGFRFDWRPKTFAGYQKAVYCRISKTGKNSAGNWPGCNNTDADVNFTTISGGYRFEDSDFVFEPGERYYIYINRRDVGNTLADGYGIHYYAQGSPANYGSSDLTIY